MMLAVPPDSDTDSDAEGFSFGSPSPIKAKSDREQFFDTLYHYLLNGDLDGLKSCFTDKDYQILINNPLKQGWTCLLYACQRGNLECVQYLIDQGADVNTQCNSMTPLMVACNSENDSAEVLMIVQTLIDHNAVVNVSDCHSKTPLMYACIRGHVDVAQKLIKMSSLESSDNDGWTVLYHAIRNNRLEIVQILLEANVSVNVVDYKGYTPRQIAEFHGFQDILDVLPSSEEDFQIPTSYLTYNHYSDLIPGILKQTDVPAYFPDLCPMLFGMGSEKLLPYFAKAQVSLEQFLSMTDDDLKRIGIKFPFQRKKILYGLLRFHIYDWSKKSVSKVNVKENIDMYDLYTLCAGHLKHCVVFKATCMHIYRNIQNEWAPVPPETISAAISTLQTFIEELSLLRERITFIQSFNPRPMLHIDYDENIRRRNYERKKRFAIYTVSAVSFFLFCSFVKRR